MRGGGGAGRSGARAMEARHHRLVEQLRELLFRLLFGDALELRLCSRGEGSKASSGREKKRHESAAAQSGARA